MKRFDIKGLFLYFFVGIGATLVEWLLFWICTEFLSIHYLIATTVAMIISTFANWLFGRLLLFRNHSGTGVKKEILSIYVASIVGWIANMVIMWTMVNCLNIHQMLSKIVATGVVFIYNYLVRKMVIYKK